MDSANKDGDELLGDVEGEGPLVIEHLRAGDSGLILRGLETVLALLAALEGVADAEIELRAVVEVARHVNWAG